MTEFKQIRHFPTSGAWRQWLELNHETENEIWILIKKAKSDAVGIRLEEAVTEALCFGWIDSIMRSVDSDYFMLHFTPRKPGSVWSKINRDRVCRLIEQGRMTETGMESVRAAKESGWWDLAYSSKEKPDCPVDLRLELASHPGALEAFEAWRHTEQSRWIIWVNLSKTPETREKRIHIVADKARQREAQED